jgi:hypothetical protein
MRVITLVAAISFLAPTAFAQTETPKSFTDTYTPGTPGTGARQSHPARHRHCLLVAHCRR